MDFADEGIARLAAAKSIGYHFGAQDAAEPVALSAIALVVSGREFSAAPLLQWLLERQSTDGSLGIDAADATPGWPTAWAIIAWHKAQASKLADAKFDAAIARGLEWLIGVEGELIQRNDTTGHDTEIPGWPWVRGTHAWLEPTALALLALKHTGHAAHVRALDAVHLLYDRMLPGGGCNYGNTIIFGQELRAHVQPTGLALLALAGERDTTDRTSKSIDYLLGELSARTATASLCYGLLGLAAHGAFPAQAEQWLSAATERTLSRDPAPYKLALLALARQGAVSSLIPTAFDEVLP
ncbi:MAG: hypothetical protein WD845_00505 [Pirellulales bacterium]